MIYRKISGHPFDTEIVTGTNFTDVDALPNLTQDGRSFTYTMAAKDVLYGLGENVRGINKRGWIYESKCSDDPNHTEDKRSLYGAYNFLIVAGAGAQFGIFIDHPGKVVFDCGYTDHDTLKITLPDDDFAMYLICEDTLPGIVHSLRRLTGRSYIPPKWALGASQSRWSYMTADEVRGVVAGYRDNGIPLDSVCLDIDYMDRYKDFTVNTEAFPDLPQLAAELKAQGVHLVPIIDAGVKVEPGYDVYEEGVQNGYFCTQEDGKPFVAGVWPGRVHFPDMLNADARRWFGDRYKVLLDQGIEGFWNDMNEPAIFYSEQTLQKTFEDIDTYRKMDLDIHTYFEFKDKVAKLSNNEGDYELFYHNTKEGRVRHDKVHNLFGYNMTRAAGEAFDRLEPDKRILMYSRSATIGMHRYGGIWMGDNCAWWSHILLSLHMLPSLNMCGFLYTGPDIGGFGCDTTEDLVLRWYGLGIFTPLLRNHAAAGTRRQEPYAFPRKDVFADVLKLRYRLLPYLYSEYMKAALGDGMYCMPLAFAFPADEFAPQVEDEVMIGESILIAPVYEQNAAGRYVYLPEDMLEVRVKCGANHGIAAKPMTAGHHYLPVALDEVVFFVRKNHLLPLADAADHAEAVDYQNLQLFGWLDSPAAYDYYDDDGRTKEYEGHIAHITVTPDGTVQCDKPGYRFGTENILLR